MRASVKPQASPAGTHRASRSEPLVSWHSPQRRGTAPALPSAKGRACGESPRITRSSCGARLRPNPSLNHRTRYGRPSWPGLAVRGTFSPARAKPSCRIGPVSSNVRPQKTAVTRTCRLLRSSALTHELQVAYLGTYHGSLEPTGEIAGSNPGERAHDLDQRQ